MEPLDMLKKLEEVMKRSELAKRIPASQGAISQWLLGKMEISPRSGKAIQMVYEKWESCLDEEE